MTTSTLTGRVIVPEDAPRETWVDERGLGVTASEVHDIMGGRSTWRRVLDAKLNGSTFRGNRHTRRGHEREAVLLDFAQTIDRSIRPNGALWASAEHPLYRGTPDGVGADCVVEVKSHAHGHELGAIPPDHRAQMQWQMLVTGARRALYVREVMDEDGQGSLADPDWQWVDRDADHIAALRARADAFIAWRDADCPEVDELDDEVAAVLAEWVEAKRALEPAAKREDAAKKKLTAALKALPHSRYGVSVVGEKGGALLTSASWALALDEDVMTDNVKAKRHALLARAKSAAASLDAYEKELAHIYGVPTLGTTQSLRLDGAR